jgi:D-xylose transport system substrate-binding protein
MQFHGKARGRVLAAGAGALAVVAAVGLGTAGAKTNTAAAPQAHAASIDVGVLLPDTQSSVRWEQFDRPYLQDAFNKAGLTASIQNAQGSATTQLSQAKAELAQGAKVLLLVNLDSGSGAAIEKLAVAKGAKVIDYDRLTLAGKASYYVSFNNVKVGVLQGQGLVKCLNAKGVKKPRIAELNGAPTDNNATLFAQGYNSILNPLYKAGKAVKVADQSVPNWDNQKALIIFKSMLVSTHNGIDGVLSANDGLANSVVAALHAKHLKQIPVTGQDATAQGIDNILAGDQCMTVYKAVKKEANAAAALAISLIKHKPPVGVNGKTNDTKRNVPSVLLTPVSVTKSNIASTVIKDGFLKWSDICVGKYAKLCPKH